MKTHQGSCHCGAVSYSVTADIEKVIDCNCSHCSRKGFLLAFVPESAFTLLSGKEALTEYRFNKNLIAHLFCKICGVQCFGYGEDQSGNKIVAINVRTIPDLDQNTLTINPVNGKDY
jgi:hypothetical protein